MGYPIWKHKPHVLFVELLSFLHFFFKHPIWDKSKGLEHFITLYMALSSAVYTPKYNRPIFCWPVKFDFGV
jgi:hypothetical protein